LVWLRFRDGKAKIHRVNNIAGRRLAAPYSGHLARVYHPGSAIFDLRQY